MLSTQLNGGSVSKYRPIGHDGEPIYKNAEAFIAALKLHPSIGESKTNCLAAPKISADGLNIDWYVPFSPKNPSGEHYVVAWGSATPQEQQQAMAILNDFEQNLRKLGMDLQRRGAEGQSKLMASYLTGQKSSQNLPAIHFPGPECVYIVDGIPVITFWGFESGSDDLSRSPMEMLRNPQPPKYLDPAYAGTGAGLAAGAGAGAGVAAAGLAGTGAANAAPYDQGNPPPQEQESKKHRCIFALMPLWLSIPLGLLGAALLLLLLWWLLPLLWGCLSNMLGLGGGSGLELSSSGLNDSAPSAQEQVVNPSTGDVYNGGDYTDNSQTPIDYGDHSSEFTKGDEIDNSQGAPINYGDHSTVINHWPHNDLSLPNVSLPQLGLSPDSLNGKFKGLDTNGDGEVDSVDITGDDQPEGLGTDPNKDGIMDAAVFDFNKDGYNEGMGVDLDGDGQLDSIGIDENKDGVIDGFDTNGDGIIDMYIGEQGGYVPADESIAVIPGIDPNASLAPTGDSQVMLDPIAENAMLDPNAAGVGAVDPALAGDTGLANDPSLAPSVTDTGALDTGITDTGVSAPGVTDTGMAGADGQNLGEQGVEDPTQAGQQGHTPPVPPELDPSLFAQNQNNQQGQAANNSAASPVAPVDPNRNLSFNQNTLKTQGVKVLNGQWSTRSGLMDSSNGRPLQMGYTIKDGKGQVEIIRADGVKCVTQADAVTSSNGVGINPTGRAVCPDNRSYQIPKIDCAAGADGVVRCKGHSGNTTFPIQLYSAQ